MRTTLLAIQIVISFILMGVILIQARGTGLGSAWGGSGETYRSKRGVEKLLMYTTIVLVTLFLLIALASFALNR